MGTYWSGKSHDLCSQLRLHLWFYPAHLYPTTWQGLPIYTLVFEELILSHFNLQRQHTLSHILTSRDSSLFLSSFWLPETAWPSHLVIQFNTRNMGVYTFCNLFLSSSAFTVRLVPASNTASEISSNPKRDKQPTWKKTCSS